VLLAFVGLLSAMLAAQIAVVVLAASLLVFPLMGRDRQAAIATGATSALRWERAGGP
jgi:uncharacterized membrane protein YsdA (DUF1294 family)